MSPTPTAPERNLTRLLQELAEHARVESPVESGPTLTAHRRRPELPATTLAAAVLLVVALVGAGVVLRHDDARRVATTGETALPEGTTDRLAPSGLAGRAGAASVWTGSEVLVWGGRPATASPGSALADGAALDPAANRWRPLPPAPLGGRGDASAVWTGSEMVVWGGSAGGDPLVDGAAYNPRTNRWRTIAPQPFGGSTGPTVLWSGTEMLVFDAGNSPPGGSAYDPRTDRWRRLAAPPARQIVPFPQAVWAGDQAVLVLWPSTGSGPGGGLDVRAGPNSGMFLASYSPVEDRWTRLPDVELKDGTVPRLVWTGTEVLALQTGHASRAYNPKDQTWRSVAAVPENRTSFASTAVWTGRLALFWAGGAEGLLYDRDADTWGTFDAGGLSSRRDAVVAWADGLLVGWGGSSSAPDRGSTVEDDGIRYRPPAR